MGSAKNRRGGSYRIASACAATVLSCAIGELALGADIYWKNPTAGDYSTQSNWIGNAVPGSGDVPHLNAYDSGVPNYTVTLGSDVTTEGLAVTTLGTIADVQLGGHTWTMSGNGGNRLVVTGALASGTIQTHLVIKNGSMVTNGSESDIGQSAGTGGEIYLTSNANWTNNGTLDVGLDGSGSVSVGQGSSMTVNGLLALGANAQSLGTMGSDGTVAVNNVEEHVGQYGTGTLYIAGGTYTVGQNLLFGVYGGSNGSAEIAAGTLVSNGVYTFIGWSGVGTVLVDTESNSGNGTQQVNGTLVIGQNAGAIGLEVLGNPPPPVQIRYGLSAPAAQTAAISNVTGDEIVGASATGNGTTAGGTFKQLSGTSTVGSLTIGQNAGSTGLYSMQGGAVSSAGSITVGQNGTGTFNHSAGTVTVVGTLLGLRIGDQAGGVGTYTLSNSAAINAPYFWIGNSGTGTFNQNGGTIAATNTIIVGSNAGSNGQLIQTSGILTTAELCVGYSGKGVVRNETSGFQTVTTLIVASQSGSNGSYEWSGTGYLSANSISVGGDASTVGGTATFSFEAPGGLNMYSDNNGEFNFPPVFNNRGQTLLGGHESWAPGSNLNNYDGVTTFETDPSSDGQNLTVNASGGGVEFSSSARLAALNISGNGVVGLIGGETLYSPTLSDTGLLEIRRGSFDLQGGGSAGLASITALVKQGYDNGLWDGKGIATSPGTNTKYGVGVLLNTHSGATILDGQQGQTAAAGDVIVAYTLVGDANLDGSVNFTDLLAVAQNYKATNTTWQTGDFNYDGTTNFADLLSMAQNYNKVLTLSASESLQLESAGGAGFVAAWAAAEAAVPEPGGLFAVGIGAIALGRRRRFLRSPQRISSGRNADGI